MVKREDCIDDIARRTGRSRKEVEDDLEQLINNADENGENLHPDLGRAAEEMMQKMAKRAALARRAEIMNRQKLQKQMRYIKDAPTELLGLQAKLGGVNDIKPGWANQDSIAAKSNMLYDRYAGGYVLALRRNNLEKLFFSGEIGKDIERELFELNSKEGGQPGVTKNAQALKIAEEIRAGQKVTVYGFNAEGGFIEDYDGFIQKTRHDADKIREAGRDKYVADVMANPGFDWQRTFKTNDRLKAVEALGKMWEPLKNNDHMDYGSDLEEQLYPDLAKKESAHREMHWKDWEGQQKYLDQYGKYTFNEAVMRSFQTMAKREALISEFGTKPAEMFESLLAYAKSMAQPTDRFQALENAEPGLRALYQRLDGSIHKPINTHYSNIANFIMAIKRLTLLVRVPFTHLAGLPVTMGSELNYWGASLSERYGSIMKGFLTPLPDSEKALAAETIGAGAWARQGSIAAAYDNANPNGHGRMARLEDMFFRATKISLMTDNHRLEANTMMMYLMGKQRDNAYADMGSYEKRVMGMFGINEPEWEALRKGTAWQIGGDKNWLTPKVAASISDQNIEAYIRSKQGIGQQALPIAKGAIEEARNDLIDRLATAFSERGRYAIFGDDPKTHAIMFGDGTSGTWQSVTWRLMAQFKQWPMQMFLKSWAREIYGREGDGLGRLSGVVDMVVAATLFGAFSEALREITQMQNPFTRMAHNPAAYLLRGWLKSGAGTIAGDFLFGEFDRHGMSAAANILGPTIGQLATQGMYLLHPTSETHPWRERGATALGIAKSWIPMVDMWWTFHAFDYLIFYRLQEAINPGYLERMEDRMKKKQGVQFLLSPQKVAGGGLSRF